MSAAEKIHGHDHGGHGDDHEDDDHDGHGHGGGGHHEEEEGEPWLMSFADMVTLLMCFFILFFSVEPASKTALTSEEKLTAQLRSVLGHSVPEKGQPAGGDKKEGLPANDASAAEQRVDVSFALGLTSANTMELVLLTNNLFRAGKADLTAKGRNLIKKVAAEVAVAGPDAGIEIEGHTDSDPLSGSGPYKTNWELSTARAAAIATLLAQEGIKGERLRATGYSHFRPLAPEFDDRGFPLSNNKALNRRIVIKLHLPQAAQVPAGGAEPRPAAGKQEKG